jgi:methionyl-tRNA formyltransferase
LKIFYIGSGGILSQRPIQALLAGDHELCGVGLDPGLARPGAAGDITLSLHDAASLEPMARSANCPLVDLTRPKDEVLQAIGKLQPDMILVSCYARRLPEALLSLTQYGAFNIHPSRLPAFRGPQPLFWQFHAGIEVFGISLHRMTGQFDAGPVINRQVTVMPDGVSMAQALARLMGNIDVLLDEGLDAIASFAAGTAQQESQASYQSYPAAEDFRVSTSWTARRIFNFMCATAHMGQAYPCRLEEGELSLRHALDFSNGKPLLVEELHRQTRLIDCAGGQLLASYHQ